MENDEHEALIALAAFIGAVVGCVGFAAATLTNDLELGALTLIGTILCGSIWWRRLRPYAR